MKAYNSYIRSSLWHFKNSDETTKSLYYIFPLMTPTQARTHKIVISDRDQPLEFDTARQIYSLRSATLTGINESANSASAISPIDTIYIYITRPAHESTSTITTSGFKFDLTGLERLAAHTSLRTLEVRVDSAPLGLTPLAEHWNQPIPYSLLARLQARVVELEYEEGVCRELSRVGRLLVEGGMKTWKIKVTRAPMDGDAGQACRIFRIGKS
jgi:hypothetical protein